MDAGKQMSDQTETFMNATELEEGFHLPALLLGITHWTASPLHWPFCRHTRSWDPWSVYPSLQENVSLAPCTYETPSFSPFSGAETYPHAATAVQDTAQHSEPARSQRSGDASASLTWRQVLQERNVTLERSSGSISHRWTTTHQDVIPTQQRSLLASTH